MCQREGKRGHLNYTGKNRGAGYLSTLICPTLGAHLKDTEAYWVQVLGQNYLFRLVILSCDPFRELGRGTLLCNSFPPPPAFSSVLSTSWMLNLVSQYLLKYNTQNTHLEEQPLACMSTL